MRQSHRKSHRTRHSNHTRRVNDFANYPTDLTDTEGTTEPMSTTPTGETFAACVTLTDKQKEAIERIRPRWHKLGEPQATCCMDNAVVVQCFYESGASMWVAIETDGYTHS